MIDVQLPRTNDQPTSAVPNALVRSVPRWLRVLAAGAVILGSIGLLWRLLSRRRSLPFPPALIWLLENPLTEGVAGKHLIERLDLRPGMRVLDVGCGAGRLTIPAARTVGPLGHVVAVDMQSEMLRRAEAKARGAGLATSSSASPMLQQGSWNRSALIARC